MALTEILCQCHNRNVIRCTFLPSLCFCFYLISHFIWPSSSFSLSVCLHSFISSSPLILLFSSSFFERLVCWWVTWIVNLHVAGLGCRSTVPDGRLVYCRRRDTASWLFQTTAVPKPSEGGWLCRCLVLAEVCERVRSSTWNSPCGSAEVVSRHRRADGVYAVSSYWGQVRPKHPVWSTWQPK